AYLVTGGLGEVGLLVAGAMAEHGARRLVLMGRSGLPPRTSWQHGDLDARTARRVAAVRALEARGVSVNILEADLGDLAAVQKALADYAREAWPPICGVVHAAGVLDNRLALQLDSDTFDRVLGPKLRGAMNLDRLLPELECFILFSSISAVLGMPGMSNYAADNAGLDALAADRWARGLPALSIQWGPWEGTGMHSGEKAERNMQWLREQGVQGFTPEQGVALFTALAGRPEAVITVMPVDWAVLQAARRGRDLRLFAGRGNIGSEGAADLPLDQRLAALAPAERRKQLDKVVREAVSRVLKIAPQRIDPAKPLGTMGLNSLMAMELRNRLEAALGRALSATLAWNYPTVDALVVFLAGDTLAGVAPPLVSSPGAAPAVAADVAALSDEEAARLLRRR
ncbi:MAG: beta-ketoacyl reductase, partial [Rhodocyclaceae bacterium]